MTWNIIVIWSWRFLCQIKTLNPPYNFISLVCCVYKVQFCVLWNSQKSGASRVFITFPQITQKILTKDMFHWLELITEILSFLQIFSVRKATAQFFIILETLPKYQQKTIFPAYFWSLKQITDSSCAYLHCTVSSWH